MFPTTKKSTAVPFPFYTAPEYNSGLVNSYLRQANTGLNALKPRDYDFSTTPVSWQDVRAQQVSASSAADEALQYNQSRLPQFMKMASDLTAADSAVRMAELDKFVPQWRSQRDTSAAINDALLRGEIPTDVANRLRKDAAFASIMGSGYGGEDNQRAMTARDLGLTSLDLQQRGQQGAQSWTTLMAGLMPEQTTAAGVMGTVGLSSAQTLQTRLQNAANQLTADTNNSQGRADTALRSQDLRLSGQRAAADADYNWANLRSNNILKLADLASSNEVNRYQADAQTRIIEGNNRVAQWEADQTVRGLNSGILGGARGFGL
jgi:hypothetical protein